MLGSNSQGQLGIGDEGKWLYMPTMNAELGDLSAR